MGTASVDGGDPVQGVELLEKEISAINLASAAAGAYEKYTLDVDRQLAESRAVATARGSQPDCRCGLRPRKFASGIGQILNEASIKTIALSQKINANQFSLLFSVLR